MRYIADSSGYLREVSFGAEITCGGSACVEYTGAVPSGYDNLEAWYIAECESLHRWKLVSGNLVEDTSVPDPTENDLQVGSGARVRTTDDGRGSIQLYKADGTLAVHAYANADSGGEVDIRDADGKRVAALYATASGAGRLLLIDADGTARTLTPEMVDQIGDAGGVSITKLWENAGTSATFPEQNIYLDLSPYDLIMVNSYYQDTIPYVVSTIAPASSTGVLTYAWGDTGTIASRKFFLYDDRVNFSATYRANNTSGQDKYIIPYRIYGIKGVK